MSEVLTPARGTTDTWAGLTDLRRLRLIGVGAPILFLVCFELLRDGVIDRLLPEPEASFVAGGALIGAALVFGLVIFFLIERTQRHVMRQNRDLAVVNTVSLAIQGELDVSQLLEAGVHRLADSTGATAATVAALRLDPEAAARDVIVPVDGAAHDLLTAPDTIVEVPLAGQAGPIGRLRLSVPASAVARLPSSEALHTVGHQLGAALQIGELVSDLQRRKAEDETIYQSLLEISNQAPLPQVLALIVRGARERLAADDGRISLAETAGDDLVVGDPIREGVVYVSTIDVPIWTPGERLGDLWLGRREGLRFTERDRRTLGTLAGICAIAITAARLRETERQGAILSERDRIARELHDSLAQVLGSTHLRLRTLLSHADLHRRGMADVAAELEDLADVAEEAYGDVREAILGLREASHPRGLLESLRAYLEKVARQSHLRIDLETAIEAEPNLPASSEIQLIRVIQEALTNVRKHAQATRARVKVIAAADDGGLMIVIEDDGRGFNPSAKPKSDGGYGLQTMRERMELAGGSLRIESQPGNGTRVIAVLPANRRDNAAVMPDHH